MGFRDIAARAKPDRRWPVLAAAGLWAATGVTLAASAVLSPASAQPFDVTNGADSGAGSLRQAITSANAAAEPVTIDFEHAGAITLTSALPAITQNVTMENTSGGAVTVSGGGSPTFFTVSSGTLSLEASGDTLTRSIGVDANGGYNIAATTAELDSDAVGDWHSPARPFHVDHSQRLDHVQRRDRRRRGRRTRCDQGRRPDPRRRQYLFRRHAAGGRDTGGRRPPGLGDRPARHRRRRDVRGRAVCKSYIRQCGEAHRRRCDGQPAGDLDPDAVGDSLRSRRPLDRRRRRAVPDRRRHLQRRHDGRLTDRASGRRRRDGRLDQRQCRRPRRSRIRSLQHDHLRRRHFGRRRP